MSRDMLSRQLCVQETLSSLSPTEEGCDPTLLVVWHPNNGDYRLLGGARFSWKNGGLQEGSCQWVLLRIPLPVSLSPQWATAAPYTGNLLIPAGRSSQAPKWSLFPIPQPCPTAPRGLTCTRPCVCSPRMDILFPPVLWSKPTGLQSQMFWGLLLLLPEPQAGEPNVWFRSLTLMGEPVQYNYFLVCGTSTQWVLDLILLLLCPFYHSTGASSLFTGCRISFVVGSVGCCWWLLTVHCDSHFSYKEVSSYSSTLSSCLNPLSQVEQPFFFLHGSSW